MAVAGDRETLDLGAGMVGAGTRVRLVASALLLAAACALRLLAPRIGPIWRGVWRHVAAAQVLVASVAPFAVWDVAAVALAVWAVVALVRRVRSHRPVLPVVSWMTLALALSLALFCGWAANHYAPSLASELGLDVGRYTQDQLADATAHYLGEAAALAPQVPRDGEGDLLGQDFLGLARVAGESYERLAGEHPVFDGPAVPVKALLLYGPVLLYSGHTGIYWAPSGESGVPLGVPPADLPFIMCHEAAHRLCIASEQQANFAAYLACDASDDVRLRYSGNYNAFCYCFNALYRADPDRAARLVQDAAEGELGDGVRLVWADRTSTREAYAAFDGPFQRVGTAVNDTYLRGFGESSGVRSYGLVVDYLIAWWEEGLDG